MALHTTNNRLMQDIRLHYLTKDRERMVALYGEEKVEWAEGFLAETDPRDYQDEHYP